MILIIFAFGLYAYLFRRFFRSGAEKPQRKLPSWEQLKSLGGMDEMLLKVIIMLLAVAFLEFMLTSGLGNLSWAVLVVPLTIIALAIGLRWMQAGAEKTDLLPSPPESAPAQEAYLLVAPYWNSARPFPQFR